MERPDILTAAPQEIFDYVVAHLAKQGERAYNKKTGACAYRTPDGKKCSVGCLLTDDLYAQVIEGNAVDELRFFHRIPERTQGLLKDLQNGHDSCRVLFTPLELDSQLLETAKKFNLSSEVVTRLSPIEWKY